MADALCAAGGTALAAMVCWRAGVVLDSPLAMAAMFAAPVALSAMSLSLTLASLLSVFAVGLALLSGSTNFGRDAAAFGFTGLSLMGAVLFCSIVVGAKLRDTRAALAAVRAQLRRTSGALDKAGVCVIVLDKNLTWLSVNEAAWSAIGCDMRLRASPDGRVEFDDEAASALMQSSSRESWRRLLESVKADAAVAAVSPGRATALSPRLATLYSLTGDAVLHRFTVTQGNANELVFVGVPIQSESEDSLDSGLSLKAWMEAVAKSLEEPAVILQADGCVLASNTAFEGYVGAVEKGARIFDFEPVEGLTEASFQAKVWSATRRGAARLPSLSLGGMEGLGARLAPPGAPHMEAVLLLFRHIDQPVPQSFERHTQAADL